MGLTQSKGNPGDDVAAETVLQSIQNFLAPVADNFSQPHTAIDCDEQRAFANPRRLRVSDDVWIDQMIPHFDDLNFSAAAVDAQFRKDTGHDIAGASDAVDASDFRRGKVDATPRREHALARRLPRSIKARTAFWRNGHVETIVGCRVKPSSKTAFSRLGSRE